MRVKLHPAAPKIANPKRAVTASVMPALRICRTVPKIVSHKPIVEMANAIRLKRSRHVLQIARAPTIATF